MTEKVKIPQNVADAIEKLRNAEYSDYGIVQYVVDGGPIHVKNGSELQDSLRVWIYENDGKNADLLLDVLRTGYEIEPEPLKVGDWLCCISPNVIGRVEEGDLVIWSDGVKSSKDYAEKLLKSKDIRHATPEEIKAEKERRKWAGIEEGDVLRNLPWAYHIGIYKGDADDYTVLVDVGDKQHIWKKDNVVLYAKKVGASNA